MTGTWFDRTKEYTARLRGENFTRYQYSTKETVVLSSLPCWQRLTPDQYRERVASLVQEIEAEAAADRKRTGIQPLGAAAILDTETGQRTSPIGSFPPGLPFVRVCPGPVP